MPLPLPPNRCVLIDVEQVAGVCMKHGVVFHVALLADRDRFPVGTNHTAPNLTLTPDPRRTSPSTRAESATHGRWSANSGS